MTEENMKRAAVALAEDVLRKMHEGPIADVSPERTKRIVAGACLAAMQEARAQTVREVALVVSKADPPARAEDAPETYAAGILAAFGVKP
jgi:hypothetical protein